MPTRALLIGVNRYSIPGADLRGCVNDVANMKSVLIDLFDFEPGSVTTLTDQHATRKAMQSGIQALLKGAKKGDSLLLHYSGHGSNVPDDDGDEADGRDEILCPTDLDWKKPLRDDWLRKTFDTLRAGVTLTVIMDCCHSGSNTRAVLPPDAPVKQRFLPSPWDLVAAESGRSLRGKVRTGIGSASRRSAKKGKKASKDIVAVDIPEILITGCRATQTSADAFFDGTYQRLTRNLVAAMRAANGKLTYRELHDVTTRGLKRDDFDQVPQLEGRKAVFDSQLFGG